MRRKAHFDQVKIVLFVLAAAVTALSIQSTPPAYAKELRYCSEEIDRFCKDVRPGEGRIANCLREHESELSPASREKYEELRNRLRDAERNCAQDVEKFCKEIQPGGGRVAKCLDTHANELSPACREKLKKAKGIAAENKPTQ